LSQNFTLPPKDGKKISVSSGPGNLKQPAQPQIHGHQCMRAKGAPTHLHVLHPPPPQISDSYKIYTTKSPKIYNICSKEKINKRFLQLTCIGKDFKTTKHQLETHKKISKIASRYNIIIKVVQN
jgi:hypothetical protein